MSKIEELADRVERLLLRHADLQRTNALLEQQLASVTQDRDSLRSRLNAARSRIDNLLERLPVDASQTMPAALEILTAAAMPAALEILSAAAAAAPRGNQGDAS